MPEPRTGPAVQKVVEAIGEDISEIVDLLQRGLEKMRDLETHSKGINGLAGLLKAKGSEIELVIGILREESLSVAKKMLSEPRPIRQSVDEEKLAEVRERKAKS